MLPLFKVYLGRRAMFSVSSLERAKALAVPLLDAEEPVRIEPLGATGAWVYNPTATAWEWTAAAKDG